MAKENNKYDLIVDMLKKSKPVFTDSEVVTNNVMRQIQEDKSGVSITELIIEFLFGWVYIGWVRKSMITVTFLITLVFGYQQVLILRRINDLSDQRIENGSAIMTNMKGDIISRLKFYKLSGRKFSQEKIEVSEKEIDELIRSVNMLQVKYKDLFNLIENDPELKKYLETRMKESEKIKSNI
jgi:hypothetical protein